MPEDRFIELTTKEFLGELSLDEEQELKLLLQDKELQGRYDLLKLFLSNNYSEHSSDEAVFERIQQKLAGIEEPRAPKSSKRKRWLYWQVAAAAIILIVSAYIFVLYQKQSTIDQVIYAKRATRKSIILSDGTKVVLNSESKLIYPKEFNRKNREVTLIGEAFFDVTKDAEHPFIIHTRKMDVRVLGTAFNVKAYPDDLFSETTLIRGKVEVVVKDRPSDKVTLKPSEKLIVKFISRHNGKSSVTNDALTEITHLNKIDTTVTETSWVYNKLVFQDGTLEDISKMIERTYDVEIDFKDESLKGLQFTGTFENSSVEDVLKALRVIEPFDYEIKNKRIIIQ